MKSIFKKIGLSAVVSACVLCAGAGVALSVPQVATANAEAVTLADRDFYVSGTGVRLINDKNGAGLRFHTNLIASEYANVTESGTLIIPNFRYDGELTLDDLSKDEKNRPTHIVTKGTVNGKSVNYWQDCKVAGEDFKKATVYLHDIPEVGYGTKMVVVSYVKIGGEYIYTSVLENSNYISLSSAAAMVSNGTEDVDLQTRLDAFIVDEVKVTIVKPDGSSTTQYVEYGEKISEPEFTYDEKWFAFNGWKDQYGNVWDFESDTVSYPVTLTAAYELTEWNQIATKVLGDGYQPNATNPDDVEKRAWVNGSTPEVLTSGIPAGFNVLNKFTWHKDSTSMWAVGGNPFYRSAYSQANIAAYKLVKFAMKVETTGDAYMKLANGAKYTNEWLTFELIQTSANVWTLNVYGENGAVVYSKAGITREISGLTNVDSIASLIFCYGTANNANLYPASTKDHEVYVYTTDVVGLRDDQAPVYPSSSATVVWDHIWNNYYFEGGDKPEGAWSDMEAPSGFTKVSEYSFTVKDFPVGHLNNSTSISKYSDLYFAMKTENATGIYVQGGTFYYGSDWVYVHLYQEEDGTWSKDLISADGYTCYGLSRGLTGTTIPALMNYASVGKTGTYPFNDKYASGIPATAYFTEVRGILKDGGASAPEQETTIIPENAVVIRDSVWRNDKYALSASTTVAAPAGYEKVSEFNWANNPQNWMETATNLPMTCIAKDDLSAYSDVYFAIKAVDGNRYYTRAGWIDVGEQWLYVHFSRAQDGTWSLSLRSEDGSYVKEPLRTGITGNNILDMINYSGSNNAFYPTRDASDPTIVYFTEVYGVTDETWGERAVWSMADKSAIENDLLIGAPVGFTSLYKKENFTMNDFATLDLSDGYYDQIKFAMIANQDFYLKSAYGYIPDGETAPRGTTAINSKFPGWTAVLNVFTLTNLGGGSWQLQFTGRLWYSSGTVNGVAKGSGQVEGTFTYTVSGNTLYEVMSNFMSKSSNATTVYCTEIRGTHTHKVSKTVSLGNGYLQDCCACGMAMSDPVAFAHGIPAEATTVLASIWRDDNYALSTSTTMEVPAGFTNIKEYDWLGNTAKEGEAWGASDMNMPTFCLNETNISAYSDLYFALRIVGGKDIYIRGQGDKDAYAGGDWLYVHYQQTDAGVWTLTVDSVDGYHFVKTGVTGSDLKTLMSWTATNNSLFPRRNPTDVAPKVYFTDVRGISANHQHVAASYVANGNDTHNVICECGDTIEVANCYGGSATCSLPSICAACNTSYGAALGHNYVWVDNKYVCDNCGESAGKINTKLDKQTVALFTNATTIVANEATTATVDLSAVTDMPISSIKDVEVNGEKYEGATLSNKQLSIPVLPQDVFGECALTATVVVQGKEFEITAPVLVVTNMITTAQGMYDMKYVLRGKTDIKKVEDLAAQNEKEYIYKGGDGGIGTMNGNGYYMLGSDVTLSTDGGGNTNVYTWGTKKVPFIGTFNGNGYSIKNFDKTNWFSGHVTEDSSVTGSYANELEGSLFGYVNGTIRNVAITGVRLGISANIVLDGKGLVEDVYVEITDLYHNANRYVGPFFWRNSATLKGTLRNVVFDLTKQKASATPSEYFPALTGKYFDAENVAVYAFDKTWIKSDGTRGNVYYTAEANDGESAGIYVEYVDGSKNTAFFFYSNLDPKIWKMVNEKAYLLNVSVSGTASAPSDIVPTQNNAQLDGYIAKNGTTQYYLACNARSAGVTAAATFIRNIMYASTGATLTSGGADADNTWRKQIIIGSFAEYQDRIDGLNEAVLSDDSYGLYLVGKTFFLLAENEESYEMMAEEFCRRIFGWTEISVGDFVYNTYTELAIPASLNYTTEIAFTVRAAAFTNVWDEKSTMNFVNAAPYQTYSTMHNALDYLVNYTGDKTNMLNVNGEETEQSEANRLGDESKIKHGEQLCYTTRGDKASFNALLNHVVNEIVNLAQEKPAMTAVNFMIEDDPDYCACDWCKKFSNPSITQLIFLNELSYALANNQTLRAAGRTIEVEFFAYSSYYHAPIMTAADITALGETITALGLKGQHVTEEFSYAQYNSANASYAAANNTAKMTIFKAADNLRLWWTSHKANHAYPLSHAANDHMYLALLAWAASVGAENIDVFMYQTTYRDYFLPLNTWEYQIIWYQELNALGIDSFMFNLGNVHNDMEGQTAFSAFKTYIDSRVMTDINVTFEQLKAEFFGVNGYYGAAGPQMLVFFEELVEALESKKQDGSNSFVSLETAGDYLDSSTFRDVDLRDINGEIIKDAQGNVMYPATTGAERIQAFFNGTYGLSVNYLLFKAAGYSVDAGANTTYTLNVTKSAFINNIYILSKYGSQQATLEAWQKMCYDALAMVDANSDYARRIKTESVFPEYAILLLFSDYSITYKRAGTSEDNKWSASSRGAQLNITTKYDLTYQSLYNKVVEVGIDKPSEFYTFGGIGLNGTAETLNTSWMSMKYQYKSWFVSRDAEYGTGTYLSASFFVNWGVVAEG